MTIEKIKKILLHHWTILISIILGAFFGYSFPEMAKKLSFISTIYLDFLQIAIVPIMIVALICSFCNIFKSNESLFYLKKISFWYFIFTCLCLLITFLVSLLMQLGINLSDASLQLLNNSFTASEANLKLSDATTKFEGVVPYIQSIIPTNIIKAIYERNDIAIVIFCSILGISLGLSKNENVAVVINFCDVIFTSFLRYVNKLIYILPIALFFLISNFVSHIGFSLLPSLFKIIVADFISIFLLFVMFSIIISKKSKVSILKSLQYLKNPYLICIGTASSLAAMPSAMIALQDNFKVSKKDIELVLPLGISLFKLGVMLRNVTVTIFLMNLYHVPFTFNSLLILAVTSIIFSVASTAGPGILTISMYTMTLIPLGIPAAVGVFLMMSLDVIVDPALTVLTLQSNCAVTLLVKK